MKAALLLFLVFYFLSASSRDTDCYCPCKEDNEDHWEVPQVNPYEDTIIVTDPYAD